MERYKRLFPQEEEVKWKTVDGKKKPYSTKKGFKVDEDGNEVPEKEEGCEKKAKK